MKQGIHPEYRLTTIRCACGAEYTVRSTRTDQRLEICGSCHPFFTGKQKLVDTAGRVEKFKRRYAQFEGQPQAAKPSAKQAKKQKRAEKAAASTGKA